MKVEINEYDDGKKAVVIDGIIITEELNKFYKLAPGYTVPEGYTVLDPLINQLSFKGTEIFFRGISLKGIIECPAEKRVLLVSNSLRDRDTATNIARLAKVVTDKEGKLEFNAATGELKEC